MNGDYSDSNDSDGPDGPDGRKFNRKEWESREGWGVDIYTEEKEDSPISWSCVGTAMIDSSDKTPGMVICYWSCGKRTNKRTNKRKFVSFYHYQDERVTVLGVMLFSEFADQITNVSSGDFLYTALPQEEHNRLFWNKRGQSFAITRTSQKDIDSIDDILVDLSKKGSLTKLDTIRFWKKGDGGDDDDDTDEIQFFCDSWRGEPSPYIGGCFQLCWFEENDRLRLELVRTIQELLCSSLDIFIHCDAVSDIILEYVNPLKI
jgi:hypothetical protein